MNILFFSRSAMNNVGSFGNTVTNLFSEWSEDNFYHFYIRKQVPGNTFVKEYYNVSSTDIMKAFLRGQSGGQIFMSSDVESIQKLWAKEEANEKRIITNIHYRKQPLLYFLEESFWATKLWQNRKFKRFIKDSNPDIFFAFATNSYILYPLIQYLKKNTRVKIVLFIVDDMLSAYGRHGWIRRRSLTKKLRWCIDSADLLYGISEKMCEFYSKEFGKNVDFLFKGCDNSKPVHESRGYPLKLVYAGNILYGREKTLYMLVAALKELDAEYKKAELDIYTPTMLQKEVFKILNVPGISRVLDAIPYEELLQVENNADILLHVESFEKEATECVRFSFSTKITDCLQSGTAVVAIGPDGIASMEYLKKIDGVTVITDPGNIKDMLGEIIADVTALNETKRKIRVFSETNLSCTEMRKKLRKDFEELIGI